MSVAASADELSELNRLRAAWAALGPSVRLEWIGHKFRPVCAASPGLSAAVGRRAHEDLEAAFSTASPIICERFLADLTAKVAGVGPRQSDPVADFLVAKTRRLVGARIQSTLLHCAYLEWAHTNGGAGLSVRRLAKSLHALGLKSIKSSVIVWLDIELLSRTRAAA